MPLRGLSMGKNGKERLLIVRCGLLSQAGLKPVILLPQKSWDHMPVPSSKGLHCILQRTTSLCQRRQGHTLLNSRAGSSQASRGCSAVDGEMAGYVHQSPGPCGAGL